jgi:hypothetical protein
MLAGRLQRAQMDVSGRAATAPFSIQDLPAAAAPVPAAASAPGPGQSLLTCCSCLLRPPTPANSVGNLPTNVNEAELRQAVNELMVQTGGTAAPGFPITSCKLYQVRVLAPRPFTSRGCRCCAGAEARCMGRRRASWPVGIFGVRPPLPRSPRAQAWGPPAAPPCRPPSLLPCARRPAHSPAFRAAPPPPLQGNGELLFSGGVSHVQDKGYAFVEFRSVEEASNAMALDGVKFRDAYLKVGCQRGCGRGGGGRGG